MVICSYPKAYVEPVPKFWNALKNMAAASADLIENLELAPRTIFYDRRNHSTGEGSEYSWFVSYDSRASQSNQVAFLRSFAARMGMLQDIATRELAHEPLTAEQIEALGDIVEIQRQYEGRRFTGWYPNLFYRNCFFTRDDRLPEFHNKYGCDRADQLVTDVHTAPYPPPGYVLHQAVGRVNFLLVAVDCGDETPVIYGGPVLSHYELPTSSLNRMTDNEWSAKLNQSPRPLTTPWTFEYVIRD
jgi:hypothetical protein